MKTTIDLTGKRALVTGGAQGIGAEICRELAACGADVAINYYSSAEKAETLASELSGTCGVKALAIHADVSKSNAVKSMFEMLDDSFGGIDILINNAGIENIHHILQLPEDAWDHVIDTNLKGTLRCSQEAGKRMARDGGGVIVNITSIHDSVPRKGLAHYCTAKAGITMLSKCMALELADNNIRVNCIAPGAIETEMNREEIKAFGVEKFNQWIPQGRIGTVQDVAPSVAFLCSDLAAYITGADLYMDGAYRLATIQYDPRPSSPQNHL